TEFQLQASRSNGELLRYVYQFVIQHQQLPMLIIDQQSSAIEPITLARSLRADPVLKQIGLLLIMADYTPTFHQQLLEAGFDGALPQPITQSALYNLLIQRLQPDTSTTPTDAEETAGVSPSQLVLIVEDYVNNQRVAMAH